METILLVDGHSMANRAFYGLPVMTNSRGDYTNALYGFITILHKTIEQVGATAVMVAFDEKAPTFRHALFADYKGTRKMMPPELTAQIPLIREFLGLAKIPVVSRAGLEADDILGTVAKRLAHAGEDVYVLTGDRDLLQLAEPNLKIVQPTVKNHNTQTVIYDDQGVKEKTGVTPREYIDVKALMGDTSDNIPGVPSIGEKTAVAMISRYHSLEEAIAHAGEMKQKAAAAKLLQYADQARLSLTLATIKTDAALEETPAPFAMSDFACEEVLTFLKKYEIKSLLTRFLEYRTPETTGTAEGRDTAGAFEAAASADAVKDADVHDMLPDTPLDEASLQTIVDTIRSEKMPLAFRIFEEGTELDGFWAIALAGSGGEVWIEETDALPRQKIVESLRPLLEEEDIPLIGHDVKKDLTRLHRMGIRPEGMRLDTMIGAYLLNPLKESYSEDELAVLFLNTTIPTEEEVLGTGRGRKKWSDLDAASRKEFGLSRVRTMRDAEPKLRAELEERGMLRLYQEIEQPLIGVLASMEETGIRIELNVLKQFGETLRGDIERLERSIYEKAGVTFNILSPKQLGEVLFERLMIPALKKTKTGYSTAAEVLEKLAPEYDIVQDVLDYRQLTKLCSTYVDGLMPAIGPDGKVHCHFNQTVTATGRLSSSDPNLQNIPIRTELGRMLRKAFVPTDERYVFIDADYSQIELRLLAHMSGDANMIRAYQEGHDIHRLTASQVLGVEPELVTEQERSAAKAVSFGIIYGISAFSLSEDLHISRYAAQDYIDRYYRQFPQIAGFMNSCIENAKEKGYAETLFGRRRPMDELKSSNFVQRSFGERVARNMPIQGTAADIMKIAMIRVHERLNREGLRSRLLLTVHDELLVETWRGEEEDVRRILKEEMMGAADLAVPLEISMAQGDDWYSAK